MLKTFGRLLLQGWNMAPAARRHKAGFESCWVKHGSVATASLPEGFAQKGSRPCLVVVVQGVIATAWRRQRQSYGEPPRQGCCLLLLRLLVLPVLQR